MNSQEKRIRAEIRRLLNAGHKTDGDHITELSSTTMKSFPIILKKIHESQDGTECWEAIIDWCREEAAKLV